MHVVYLSTHSCYVPLSSDESEEYSACSSHSIVSIWFEYIDEWFIDYMYVVLECRVSDYLIGGTTHRQMSMLKYQYCIITCTEPRLDHRHERTVHPTNGGGRMTVLYIEYLGKPAL